MQSWSSKDFTADRAWGALDIANFSGTTVPLPGSSCGRWPEGGIRGGEPAMR